MDRNYKNTFCGILILAILLMAVGYSILSTRLNVEGTSKITSDFNIQVTGISEFFKVGLVETSNIDFTSTSATYGANIQAPGDEVIYEIIIENKGNMSGFVYFNDSTVLYRRKDYNITVDGDVLIGVAYASKTQADKKDPVFKSEISNTTELLAGEKLYVYAVVSFSSQATKLPDKKNYSNTVDFNFYSNTELFPKELPKLNDALLANNSIVTSGDGLMLNDDWQHVFVSDGDNDNIKNYISIDDKLMRIVKFEDNMENSCSHDTYYVVEADDVVHSGVVYNTVADEDDFYNAEEPTLFEYMETSNPLFQVSSVSYLSWWTYGKSYSGYQVFYVENSHLFPHSSYTDGHRYILSIPEVMEASTNSSCNFANLSTGGCKSWLTTNGDTYLFNLVYGSDETTNTGKVSYLKNHNIISVDPRDTNNSNVKGYGAITVAYGGSMRYTNEDADGSRNNPYIIDPISIEKGANVIC